jgi:hypothetical protein
MESGTQTKKIFEAWDDTDPNSDCRISMLQTFSQMLQNFETVQKENLPNHRKPIKYKVKNKRRPNKSAWEVYVHLNHGKASVKKLSS